jgi:hypothetical protein
MRLSPVAVPQVPSGLVLSGSSAFHTCAIVSGALECWGANDSGQLGDGTTKDRSSPSPVSGLDSGVEAVRLGAGMT